VAHDRCELLCLDLDVAEAIRHERPSPEAVSRATTFAAALADPTRLRVAVALSRADELCVCDLAWIAERSQNLVSHHLRVLRSADLVESRRDGKMVLYSLTSEGTELLDMLLREEREIVR
jgi:DNA-binding transcriptional ArsR family regulator